MTSAFARRMIGEAFMTQWSATPKILFQILDAHLHWRNVMFVKKIEKPATLHAKHLCRLTLRKPSFLKPLEHGCNEQFATNLAGIFSQDTKRVIRKFDCHRLHASKLLEFLL